MRFTYCPHCGSELIKKEIGDEGLIPFCEKCSVPMWDMFTTTGNIDIYLKYKRHEKQKERVKCQTTHSN